jgi:chorismate dehydratase
MYTPRVGHIDFLNVLPLTYSLQHGGAQGLEIHKGVPTELNSDITAGRLDVSAVSSLHYACQPEAYVVLPGVCIASDGDVQSIILVSKKPIDTLEDDRIILSAQSATSHVLLKIILRSSYGAFPHYEVRTLSPAEPVPEDATAALFIGNDALYLNFHHQQGLYYYDLGQEWKSFTGQQMVYALWVARKEFAEAHPQELAQVYDCIRGGLADGLAHKTDAIRSLKPDTPFTEAQLDNYLGGCIKWELTDNGLIGLKLFYELACRGNYIKSVPHITLADVKQ